MQANPEVALEGGGQRAPEVGMRVQPCHLVFVLAGGQPERAACHGLRQSHAAWHGLRFHAAHLLDQLFIAPRGALVLVIGEELTPACDELGQPLGQRPPGRRRCGTRREPFHASAAEVSAVSELSFIATQQGPPAPPYAAASRHLPISSASGDRA